MASPVLLLQDVRPEELGDGGEQLLHVADQALHLLLLSVLGPALALNSDIVVTNQFILCSLIENNAKSNNSLRIIFASRNIGFNG